MSSKAYATINSSSSASNTANQTVVTYPMHSSNQNIGINSPMHSSNQNIGINSVGGLQPSGSNIWTTISYPSSDCKDESGITTIELHTIDDKKCLIRLGPRNNLTDIEERTEYRKHFSWKFPFIKREKIVYTHFMYQQYCQSSNRYIDKEFNVKCTLSALCKLIGVEYEGFSTAILEDAVENG